MSVHGAVVRVEVQDVGVPLETESRHDEVSHDLLGVGDQILISDTQKMIISQYYPLQTTIASK